MNQSIILEGVVDTIFPTEFKGSYQSRVLWLRENITTRPNVWELRFENDDGDILDKFREGQPVICDVSVKGVRWGKAPKVSVFNILRCTNIKKSI